MSGRWTPRLMLVLVAVLATTGAVHAKDDATDCKTAATVNSSEGKLKVKGGWSQAVGQTCEWIINGTDKAPLMIHIDLFDNLVLHDNDQLTITSEDNQTTYHTSKGFLQAGVILTANDVKVVRVKMQFSTDKFERTGTIGYGTNDSTIQIQNIQSAGGFAIPLNNATEVKKEFNFDISFRALSKTDNVLLSLQQLTLNGGKVSFDKVDKYEPNKQFDEKDPPEFILSQDQQINMKITGLKIDPKSATNGIKMHYELVDSFCTQYKLITDTDTDAVFNFKQPTPSDLTTLFSYRCLNIFEHKDESVKLLFDLMAFNFLNTADMISVLDGNRRNSTSLAQIDSQYIDLYWRKTYLFSSSNKLWVMLDSPQVLNRNSTNPKNSFGVRALSQGGSFVLNATTNTTKLQMKTTTKPKTPVVFIFTSTDFEKQIIIDFDNNKKLPGNGNDLLLSISDGSYQGSQPFIKMNSGEYPPDIMASSGAELKVVFNQVVDLTADVKIVDKGCHSSVIGNSGTSYSLSGCDGVCSWLIPKRDNSNGTFILQFSQLNLTAKTDELRMEMLANKSSVFSLKGPLQTTTFPDLVLDANQSYVMYTTRTCPTNVTDKSQVLTVSLVYDDTDDTTHDMTAAPNTNIVLKTPNYPNYYPVGTDQTWKVSPTKQNDTFKALLTFTDIDLIAGHQLLVWEFGKDKPQPVNTSVTAIHDLLITHPLAMNLTASQVVSNPFSGRGFSANLTVVSCGESAKVEANKPVTLSTPNQGKDIKGRCIWMVTTDRVNATLLNTITVNFTKGNEVNLTTMVKIYDSFSIRDNRLLNMSYFPKGNYTSSTDTLIIVYDLPDKKDQWLNMTFQQQVCGRMCGNTVDSTPDRCMLPEFQCNHIDDCTNLSDEYCPYFPMPPSPPPAPIINKSGVNGWVVFLVICPLCIGIGVLGTMFGPNLMRRFGRGRYREFQDFSEVS